MNGLSPETIKKYREVAFDSRPETVKEAEAQGFLTGDNPNWCVTKAYRDNYDKIEWDKSDKGCG